MLKRTIRLLKLQIVLMVAILPLSLSAQTTKSDATLIVASNTTVSGQTYTSSTQDVSPVKVTAGTLTISKCAISSSANGSSADDASFYGTNAMMLSYGKLTSPIINSTGNYLTGTGNYTNGIFAYGNGVITSTNDVVTNSGGNARGIMASGGGTITAIGDTATTTGGSSSVVATDKGGGTINVTGGVFTASGSNSAGIYSTGVINATDATFVSNGGEAMVLEGSNKINTTNCSFTSKKNKWGVLLYQSFSGDASSGDYAALKMNGGTLTYEGTSGGMFYNTNNTDSLTLNGVTLVNSCDTLVRVLKGGWGNNASPSKGGTLYFICTGQTMKGIIYADANSTIYNSFLTGTAFTGSINASNTASLVTLKMDAASTWTLTADSYINGLITNPSISGSSVSNIVGNGYNVWYTKSTNSSLNGETYSLSGGGYLLPVGSSVPTSNEAVKIEAAFSVTPNPFSDALNIVATLPQAGVTTACLYDFSGRLIRQVSFGKLLEGTNRMTINGLYVPAGIYLLNLKVSGTALNETKKLIKR